MIMSYRVVYRIGKLRLSYSIEVTRLLLMCIGYCHVRWYHIVSFFFREVSQRMLGNRLQVVSYCKQVVELDIFR